MRGTPVILIETDTRIVVANSWQYCLPRCYRWTQEKGTSGKSCGGKTKITLLSEARMIKQIRENYYARFLRFHVEDKGRKKRTIPSIDCNTFTEVNVSTRKVALEPKPKTYN